MKKLRRRVSVWSSFKEKTTVVWIINLHLSSEGGVSPRKPLIASFPKHQLRSQWLAMARAGTSLNLQTTIGILSSILFWQLYNLKFQEVMCLLFSFVQPFYLFKSLCVHFFFFAGFLLLLISNWFKIISPTISIAPEGYSCCPIVTVEVFKSCYYGDFVAAHCCSWCSCSSQHAHGDFVELNGIYILVVEEVRH